MEQFINLEEGQSLATSVDIHLKELKPISTYETQSISEEKVMHLEPIKSENDSLTLDFLEKISKLFHADVFVETGTLAGGTAAEASKTFREVHTIELSKELFLKATERFQNNSNVNVYHGDSAVVLKNILPSIQGKIVFWLDSHYSGGETARGSENTPIMQEIEAIRRQNIRDSVILIDDIRCFYRDPNPASIHYGYPTVRELSSAILAIDPEYCIEVIGDALISYPLHDEVHLSQSSKDVLSVGYAKRVLI